MSGIGAATLSPNLPRRHLMSRIARGVFCLATWAGVFLLAVLLVQIGWGAAGWLDWQFLTSFPSRFAQQAGIKAALVGTLWLISLTALFAVPVGVGAAIYLEEYAKKNWLNTVIEINIANLAGTPSIVYGILGLALFVRGMALGRSVLAGALTMSLLILPVTITASREALRAVPKSIRLASYAVGATRWQTIFHHLLPAALPGIMTGIILALSRAIGETAPLVMIGALSYVAFVPAGPMDSFSALPIQIFNWASRPQKEFYSLAAAGIVVLLVVLLAMNAAAIWIRARAQKATRW
jgi:phosphate transport system permease protein